MFVDIAGLRERKQPFRLDREFGEEELSLVGSDVATLKAPAHCICQVSVAGGTVRVSGQVTARLLLSCSRCLREYEKGVTEQFDLSYVPDPRVSEGEEISLGYQELTLGFYRQERLDLGGVFSEQILLQIPMKPVCQGECKGLCSHCGIDLNEGSCDCNPVSLDPRLAPLAALKKNIKEK
jgi:uncharacterized protein